MSGVDNKTWFCTYTNTYIHLQVFFIVLTYNMFFLIPGSQLCKPKNKDKNYKSTHWDLFYELLTPRDKEVGILSLQLNLNIRYLLCKVFG